MLSPLQSRKLPAHHSSCSWIECPPLSFSNQRVHISNKPWFYNNRTQSSRAQTTDRHPTAHSTTCQQYKRVLEVVESHRYGGALQLPVPEPAPRSPALELVARSTTRMSSKGRDGGGRMMESGVIIRGGDSQMNHDS